MALTPQDAKERVEELYNAPGWTALRADDDKNKAVLYGDHGALLAADLQETQLQVVAPAKTDSIEHHSKDAEAQMADDDWFRVVSSVERWKGWADQMEVAAAWLRNKLDPGGRTSADIIRGVVARPMT